MKRILDELKPEAVYFTEYGGHRGAIMIINVDDPLKVPTYAEPWFLTFNADCEFHIVMTPEDLAKAGRDRLGKKWSQRSETARGGRSALCGYTRWVLARLDRL